MFSTCSKVIILALVALATSARAAGVGKAWEVSPVQSADNPAPLSTWPRTDNSPFEVRSISGVGRLTPSEAPDTTFDLESPSDAKKTEKTFASPREGQSDDRDPIPESSVQSRQSRELEDLENGNVFVPESIFHDPTVDGFFRKSKEVEDVEALPSLWRKIRNHGRTGRNHGHCSEVEEVDDLHARESHQDDLDDKPRVRREVEPEMEKIAASKNVREGRQSSPESWSKQPLSVEFRHRTSLDSVTDEDKFARSTARGFQAPRVDFVTANRRSYNEGRESRDLPLASSRSFDEAPTYRNTLRDRDLDAPYSRALFYPERYRTERDYFVRGLNEPAYPQDRYRDVDFDLYGRSRPPMPKPKRIIYYATLPEVVRKPVDLRSYPRPYDTMTRSSTNVIPHDGYYNRRGGAMDTGRYRYYSYPWGSNYDNYDMYPKKTWNDRPYTPYPERMEDARRRDQGNDHGDMRDASRTEQSMLELGHERKMTDRPKSRDQEKAPWPVKIGTEVSVKDNERVTGRKIFGQHEEFNRFRSNARIDRDRESTGSVESRD